MKPVSAGALMSRTDEIRSMLRELMHPDCRVQVCADGQACDVRILGPDWQLRHFFWRPRDIDRFEIHLRGARPYETMTLDFSAGTPDGADVRFRVPAPLVLRFPDRSAAMLSAFPDCMWYQGTRTQPGA
ncbi:MULTISPECIES: hypothetical protein [Bordetella]|uniref:Uncharacterized protein n=1 Tax=Bordetella genomosp. 2 TaxID=1983456 RepID=A0A261VPB7_9BORD|nr:MULTISPECIES: hypothetical protein [Bordetella]OZI75611.1 hypothetical protein CAL24_10295 [Bordetella genomosp. 2]